MNENSNTPIFRILAVGEFHPRPDYCAAEPEEFGPFSVNINSFDELMKAIAPTVAIDIEDPFFPSNCAVRIDLRWTEWKDLLPSSWLTQVPILRNLVEARKILQQGELQKWEKEEIIAQLSRILSNQSWVRKIEEHLWDFSVPSTPLSTRGELNNSSSSSHSTDPLDSILRLACLPGDSEQMNESTSSSRKTSSNKNALELVEQAFQSILLSILAHPEIHRLESVWRGIRLLLQNVSGNTVQVSVLSSSLDEIASHLDQIADFPENLFDLILVDTFVVADSAQLQRLQHWAMASQRLMTPLLVGGKASLLGFDHLLGLGKSNSQFTNSSEPRAVLTRNTCTSEAMRWVGCVLNKVVARLPYNSSTARIRNMPFSEPDQRTVFANGVYVLAALVARSFSEGHPFQFSGQQFGVLNDLKIHLITDQGGQVAIPTEELVSLESQNMAARAGFILLGAIPNRDRAIITQARMMYRGTSHAMGTPEATQSLANQLAIAQMAKTIEIVADAIPTGTEHQIIQGVFSIAIADIFQQAFPKTPETIVRTVPNSEYLEIIVKPHGEPVIDIPEITFRTKVSLLAGT